MQKVIQGLGIAAIVVLATCANMGCSMIGAAIDGSEKLDSLSVMTVSDSVGLGHRFWDMQRLASLAREASSVEVFTFRESLKGDGFTLDTLLAVKGGPSDSVSEWLLPGELVTLTTNVTQVKGEVLRLSEEAILLRVDGQDAECALKFVETISQGDQRELSARDLKFPKFSERLVKIPRLVLEQEAVSLFIPLREVERIKIGRVTHTARTIGIVLDVVVGTAVVIGAVGVATMAPMH
jgi:hypothetical protein